MKVVHLFANWKWTGPAEPAVNLAAALARRGHEVHFFSGEPVDTSARRIADFARERGLLVREGLRLPKHFRLLSILADRRKLTGWLDGIRPDIVHCHTLNDHFVGEVSMTRRPSIPLVRSLYDDEVRRRGIRGYRAFSRHTSFLLAASEAVRAATCRRFGVPEGKTMRLEGAVDLARFDPGREVPDLREEFGIEEGDFVLGIVARMQPRRRFDVFFDALDQVAEEVPNLRVLMVGRGTHMQRVAVSRAERGLLSDRIVFTGYRSGDEYVATLRLLSAKVFLWPGSDGSCRAAREAMAMGVPVIAANVGMLDEIVTDGRDGILIHHPAALAHSVRRLALGLGERDEMAAAARETARTRFDLDAQAARVEEVYTRLLD